MNIRSRQLINALFDGLSANQITVVYDGVPSYVVDYVDQGRDYKRAGQYDNAVDMYVKAIDQCRCLVTEVGRMFAKTLCAMNEYGDALFLLLKCAQAKWEDKIHFPKTGNAILDEYNEKLYGGKTMPTASAADFYELRDCMVAAAKGNLTPLFERTKAVSGNPNYRNVKTNQQIQNEVYEFCKAAKLI